MTYTVQIRPKRQITLPMAVTKGLDLEVGDSITINLKGDQAILTPNKQAALNALAAIQKAFAESGISEAEFLAFADANRKAAN